MRAARIINPGSWIYPRRFHHEREVVHPLAYRPPIPSWLRNLLGDLSPVHPDVAPHLIIFIEDGQLFGGLIDSQLPQVKEFDARESQRIAYIKGIINLINGHRCDSPPRLVGPPRFLSFRRERQSMFPVGRLFFCASCLGSFPPSVRLPNAGQVTDGSGAWLLRSHRFRYGPSVALDMLGSWRLRRGG